MGGTDEIDPYGVVPDGFCEAWGEESIPAALEAAERASGTTDRSEKPRCPACRVSTRIRKKQGKLEMPHQIDAGYKCQNPDCTAHFDDPAPPFEECPIEAAWIWLADNQHHREKFIKTMPINTGFDWCTDLKDPDDRESIIPFADVERERAVELAIRMREPWTDGGPSYDQIAELLPYEDSWVGHRVREWRDGDHRDLVADPTTEAEAERTPEGDPFVYGRAVATDGGREESRWAAYGG